MNRSLEQKLEQIISRMQADSSIDPPAAAVKYVSNLFRARPVEPELSIVQRIFAVLKVDLAPNRAAFGERSTAGGTARQMLFDTGDSAVDLRIMANEATFDIRGQILGDGFAGADVVIAGDDVSIAADVDEESGFRFAAVPAGKYSLTINSLGREIVIQELTLG